MLCVTDSDFCPALSVLPVRDLRLNNAVGIDQITGDVDRADAAAQVVQNGLHLDGCRGNSDGHGRIGEVHAGRGDGRVRAGRTFDLCDMRGFADRDQRHIAVQPALLGVIASAGRRNISIGVIVDRNRNEMAAVP